MSTDDFKEIAEQYAEVSKDITGLNKRVRDLKTQKDQIGESILAFMQSKNIDEAELPGIGKIVRKKSKRTETLKPELILATLTTALGDEAKATQALQDMNSQRSITEKEVITLTKSRQEPA
jgi:hypothetical protein